MKIKRNRFFGNFLQEVPSLVPEKRPPKAEITTTLEAIGEKIRRVGKYHVELEIKFFEKFETITMSKNEIVIG
jgi:hypothetical protein